MPKRNGEECSNSIKKKTCTKFKSEWLNEIVESEVPSSTQKQKVKLGVIFTLGESGDVLCNFCAKANAACDFSTGKKWEEWKLDYLKRHLNQKVHLESVVKLRNQTKRPIQRMLTETAEDRETRAELVSRKKTKADMVKTLIDDVLLAIRMNASMLSVQDIHEHMAKYTEVPESWRSKNYAFEFVNCINVVVQNEVMDELRKSSFHTLIADESTDISVHKMLILYIKFRAESDVAYKTIFAGILKLTSCDSSSIVAAIKEFYIINNLDLQKMVMITSDGASVMLGKNNGVAAVLRRDIKHLSEQHCVAHREDLGIDDACKKVSIMGDIETLLRTVYSMFSRSSVKKVNFEELAEVTDRDVVAFRPLNEVRWLSRHFAVTAVMRNYDVLIDYCKEQVNATNDPICKYCLKTLSNPQYRVALTILDDVLEELASLCKFFQKSCLTTIEAMQFAKAKISKLRAQYLGEEAFWSEKVNKCLVLVDTDVDKAAILRFIERLCDHLDKRFPEDELADWIAFDPAAIANASRFDFGKANVTTLIEKYADQVPNFDDVYTNKIQEQYADFKFLVAEKMKTGCIKTFSDAVDCAMRNEQFQELFMFLDICATFQASSADCERGFSLMNMIKTKSRNRLEVEHLSYLMRIKSYMSLGKKVDLDAVYSHWITNKDRREKIESKH